MSFSIAPDLTDPKQVSKQCDMYAEYIAQQAEAIARGTATGSHPNPGHFYGEMAKTMRAASDLLAKAVVAAPPAAPGPVDPPVPAPPPPVPVHVPAPPAVEDKPKPQQAKAK